MVRPPCGQNLTVKRAQWPAEQETHTLAKHAPGSWTAVRRKTGLSRGGKSCRVRGANNLRTDPRHENFTPQEEELIIRLHAAIGSRWSIIAQQLPGRTDNDVKNCWNAKLKKKLSEMGIDPVTHKPFSQILADYGTIGGFPDARNQIEPIDRNPFVIRTDQFPIPKQEPSSSNPYFMPRVLPMPTITDPTQNNWLNKGNNHCANNHSLDLLAQLQSITLVTEASNVTNHETKTPRNYYTCPSSSSSTTDIQVISSPMFSWRDFLIEDPSSPADALQKDNMAWSPNGSSSQGENEIMQKYSANHEGKHYFGDCSQEVRYHLPINNFEASTSCDNTSSFVEGMLDQENNMLLEFPALFEESFYD